MARPARGLEGRHPGDGQGRAFLRHPDRGGSGRAVENKPPMGGDEPPMGGGRTACYLPANGPLRRCAKITSATPSGMIKNACFSRVLSVIAPAPLLKLFLRTALVQVFMPGTVVGRLSLFVPPDPALGRSSLGDSRRALRITDFIEDDRVMIEVLISEASREASRSHEMDGRSSSPDRQEHHEPQRPRSGSERDPHRNGNKGRFLGPPFPFP